MFMMSISFLTFAIRNLHPSKERQIICFTLAMMLFGLSCMGLYELIQGNVNSSIYVSIVVETILWISFGRMAMMNIKQKVVGE